MQGQNHIKRLTNNRVRDKFDVTGSVANAPKAGRSRTSRTEENEMRVAMTFVNSPKKSLHYTGVTGGTDQTSGGCSLC